MCSTVTEHSSVKTSSNILGIATNACVLKEMREIWEESLHLTDLVRNRVLFVRDFWFCYSGSKAIEIIHQNTFQALS